MHKVMKKYKQLYLYHFTDTRNIEGIVELGGLYSFKRLDTSNIEDIFCGGNDWSHDADIMSGVDDYVHLCFTTNHPMEYLARQEGRIQETFWIKVHRDVLRLKGVMFTNDVSNKAGVELLTNEEAVEELDHDAIFNFIDFDIPGNLRRKQAAEKYEILVPKHIPLEFLVNING